MSTSLIHSALGRRKLTLQPLAHAASLPTTELAAAAMAHWPVCGDVEVVTPSRNGMSSRHTRMQISIGVVIYRQTHWVARFREENAPQGVKPLEWFLVSQWRLHCAEEACALLEHRPDLVTRHRAGRQM